MQMTHSTGDAEKNNLTSAILLQLQIVGSLANSVVFCY